MTEREKILRYTTLSSLIDILIEKRLLFRDPEKWNDKNDAFSLAEYQRRKKVYAVRALCFTAADESSLHWASFAPGTDGVCIVFDRRALETKLRSAKIVKFGKVNYCSINDLRKKRHTVEKLPFLKRIQFQHEHEYRLVHSVEKKGPSDYSLPIEPDWILEIKLSNLMPNESVKSVKIALARWVTEQVKIVHLSLIHI